MTVKLSLRLHLYFDCNMIELGGCCIRITAEKSIINVHMQVTGLCSDVLCLAWLQLLAYTHKSFLYAFVCMPHVQQKCNITGIQHIYSVQTMPMAYSYSYMFDVLLQNL